MIELLMVIIIIALLMALLLPAVNSAMRTARNAAVSSEIAQLAQALESFKAKYGDYPPSRVLLVRRVGITLRVIRQYHDLLVPAVPRLTQLISWPGTTSPWDNSPNEP